jgi:hypothetical protein
MLIDGARNGGARDELSQWSNSTNTRNPSPLRPDRHLASVRQPLGATRLL